MTLHGFNLIPVYHCVSPAMVCVVRVEGTPYLCQTDEVGEICVSSGSTGVAYYGLPGMTKNIFEVRFLFLEVLKCKPHSNKACCCLWVVFY